jgi:hypothetical protein
VFTCNIQLARSNDERGAAAWGPGDGPSGTYCEKRGSQSAPPSLASSMQFAFSQVISLSTILFPGVKRGRDVMLTTHPI